MIKIGSEYLNMSLTSLSISSFGYLGAGTGFIISGSGNLYSKHPLIRGGDIAHNPALRLFYINGVLLSRSEIEGIVDGWRTKNN